MENWRLNRLTLWGWGKRSGSNDDWHFDTQTYQYCRPAPLDVRTSLLHPKLKASTDTSMTSSYLGTNSQKRLQHFFVVWGFPHYTTFSSIFWHLGTFFSCLVALWNSLDHQRLKIHQLYVHLSCINIYELNCNKCMESINMYSERTWK